MKTISTTGTDCFRLAAQYLGDATQFIRIMQQNDLSDPTISGPPQTLLIPDKNAADTGGVPTQ